MSVREIAKSPSAEHRVGPCSIASAARWAGWPKETRSESSRSVADRASSGRFDGEAMIRRCIDQDVGVEQDQRKASPSATASVSATLSMPPTSTRPRSTGWVRKGFRLFAWRVISCRLRRSASLGGSHASTHNGHDVMMPPEPSRLPGRRLVAPFPSPTLRADRFRWAAQAGITAPWLGQAPRMLLISCWESTG
jgi:hypothetical protein